MCIHIYIHIHALSVYIYVYIYINEYVCIYSMCMYIYAESAPAVCAYVCIYIYMYTVMYSSIKGSWKLGLQRLDPSRGLAERPALPDFRQGAGSLVNPWFG